MRFYVLFRNSFSQLVGEEFLKFFDFGGDSLDVALRRFVQHLTAANEPQDYDQLLSHFAQRYHSCNSDQFKSAGNMSITCSFSCQLSLSSLQGRQVVYQPPWLGLRSGTFTWGGLVAQWLGSWLVIERSRV